MDNVIELYNIIHLSLSMLKLH